jgi:hypothetical protein
MFCMYYSDMVHNIKAQEEKGSTTSKFIGEGGKEVQTTALGGVPITSDLGAANTVISHTVTVVEDEDGNAAATPESIETRIKNTIFKILKLPLDGIEYAKAHVEVIAGKVDLVIKTDIENAKIDIEKFLHHDRFSRDAINEGEQKKEFHFTPPESTKKDFEQLAGLTTNLPEDGVIGKEDSINKLLDNLEKKATA